MRAMQLWPNRVDRYFHSLADFGISQVFDVEHPQHPLVRRIQPIEHFVQSRGILGANQLRKRTVPLCLRFFWLFAAIAFASGCIRARLYQAAQSDASSNNRQPSRETATSFESSQAGVFIRDQAREYFCTDIFDIGTVQNSVAFLSRAADARVNQALIILNKPDPGIAVASDQLLYEQSLVMSGCRLICHQVWEKKICLLSYR
jgi:hypothetical protein